MSLISHYTGLFGSTHASLLGELLTWTIKATRCDNLVRYPSLPTWPSWRTGGIDCDFKILQRQYKVSWWFVCTTTLLANFCSWMHRKAGLDRLWIRTYHFNRLQLNYTTIDVRPRRTTCQSVLSQHNILKCDEAFRSDRSLWGFPKISDSFEYLPLAETEWVPI